MYRCMCVLCRNLCWNVCNKVQVYMYVCVWWGKASIYVCFTLERWVTSPEVTCMQATTIGSSRQQEVKHSPLGGKRLDKRGPMIREKGSPFSYKWNYGPSWGCKYLKFVFMILVFGHRSMNGRQLRSMYQVRVPSSKHFHVNTTSRAKVRIEIQNIRGNVINF